MKLHTIVVLVSLATACTPPRKAWVEAAWPGDFPTEHGPVERTDDDVRYSGDADPDLIDATFASVSACLSEVTIDDGMRQRAVCFDGRIEANDDPVVVTGAWRTSCSDPTQQTLTVEAPVSGCLAKGTDHQECGCYWRVGYRYAKGEDLYIVTPSLYMLPDVIVRVWTACRNPWADPTLARCASPSIVKR